MEDDQTRSRRLPNGEQAAPSGFRLWGLLLWLSRLGVALAFGSAVLVFLHVPTPLAMTTLISGLAMFGIAMWLPNLLPEAKRRGWAAREFTGKPKVRVWLNGQSPALLDKMAADYGYQPLDPDKTRLVKRYVRRS
ncbi:hypothetical protein AB5J62_00195 [Amycolatopsis sp. cg5]|uniref:hypothetical protein n=1 Tax=Amycolatopsis sp. cg5 TaxID=3238802 RepID=UPI0035268BBF